MRRRVFVVLSYVGLQKGFGHWTLNLIHMPAHLLIEFLLLIQVIDQRDHCSINREKDGALLLFLSIALLFLCFCWFSRDTYSHLLLFHLTIIIGLLKRNTTEDDYNPSHQTCSKLMLNYSFHSVFFFLFIKHLL